jgi:serine/threonine protein kinase
MSLVDTCLIGKQVIDRIQWVHYKNIVHRDIKPDIFLIGLKDPNVIYLIDFGLSKKYRSSTTK